LHRLKPHLSATVEKGTTLQRKELGIAVIGSGRIGTLRARLAAKHPALTFLAISDLDPARARALAEQTGADLHTGNNFEAIDAGG
jgi:predicted dehydrogenase